MAAAHQIDTRVITRADEVANRFRRFRRRVDVSQEIGAQQLRQFVGIAAIGLTRSPDSSESATGR